ncbi:hypothetical protein ACKGJI_00040 [Sulfurospirillum sp. 1307]|jgi:hypothetical protein
MFFKKIKIFFLSFFREFFVYHHTSLEFRAKIFASMIATKKLNDECEYEILKDIAKDIYKNDEYRIDILIHTTKEYIKKVVQKDFLDIDKLLLDIDRDLRKYKRFAYKINLDHLKQFFNCKGDEETVLLQTRILEYFESELISRGIEISKEQK